MSRYLLIIAPPGSYRLAPYLKAAAKLNLTPLIASTSEHAILPRGCEGMHINIGQPEQAIQSLLETAQIKVIAGIIGTDDATIEIAASVAAQLGLPHNPPEAARFTHRKDLARDFLQQAGLNIPWHQRISINQDINQLDIPYPVVVKPLNLSASRGVIRANNTVELQQAIEKIVPLIEHSDDLEAATHLLLEQYIDGIEIAYDGLLDHGSLYPLATFDKPDPLTGPYFEETYYISPSRLPADTLSHCEEQIRQCCKAYGLTTGPIHAELRIDNQNKPWLLEVAARTIGGECGQSIKPAGDYSLEELVVSYAVNQPIKPEPQKKSSGVLMIPVPKAGILKRVEGILEAQGISHITRLTIDIPSGNEVQTLPESSSYLGFIFAEADTPEEVEAALREAHSKLNFVINPVWSIQM